MMPSHTETHPIGDVLERLQVCASLDKGSQRRQWLEILGLSKNDYQSILRGHQTLPDTALASLAHHLDISAEDILAGSVDYRAVSVKSGGGMRELPEPYTIAAFSRRRTTITSYDYIEKALGWRVRANTLKHFRVNESVLSDPMASISMQFITDTTSYLRAKYRLTADDFFKMGVHSSIGNRNTLIGAALSSAENIAEAYVLFIEELLKFFEHNWRYTIHELNADSCTIDAVSHPHVAEALGIRQLGNRSICMIRVGMLASLPHYIDQPQATVTEVLCAHRGDHICRYKVVFPDSASSSLFDRQH